MKHTALITWLCLLVLLAAELGLTLAGYAAIAPLIGVGMVATVAFGFMRLGRAPSLSRYFAAAAMFWLLVLLGLGSVDYFTRIDVPVAGWPRSAL